MGAVDVAKAVANAKVIEKKVFHPTTGDFELLDASVKFRDLHHRVVSGAFKPEWGQAAGAATWPVFDLCGSRWFHLKDFVLAKETQKGMTKPAVGLMLGRTSNLSAQGHKFTNCHVLASCTHASIYNCGSELFEMHHSVIINPSGHGYFTSSWWPSTSILSTPHGGVFGGTKVGGRGAVSNVVQWFHDSHIGTTSMDKTHAAMRIEPRAGYLVFERMSFSVKGGGVASILLDLRNDPSMQGVNVKLWESILIRGCYAESGDNKNYLGDVVLVGKIPKGVVKRMKAQIKADNPGFRKGLAVLPSL